MMTKASAFLICTLMIASSLAGCAGMDDGPPEVMGCLDSDANNFNADATEDDGSCDYDADDDGTPDNLEVDGCTDDAANNHDETATEDDGSCDYDLDDDGVLDADEVAGCTDSDANNFNTDATDDDSSCDYDADDDGIPDNEETAGCTDSSANNYNQYATDDDGTCDFDLDDDGVLDADEVAGCTDSTASNYNQYATDDDNSCDYWSLTPASGISADFVTSAWDPIIPNLNGGEMCDAILSAMTKTAARDEVIDFTRGYYTSSQGVIGGVDAASIGSVDDLNAAGTTIALQSGTTSDIYASENLGLATILAYEDFPSVTAAVANGDADYALGDAPVLALSGTLLTTFSDETFGIGVREDSNDLRDALDVAITAIIESGDYDHIFGYWFDGMVVLTDDTTADTATSYPEATEGSTLTAVIESGSLQFCSDTAYMPFEGLDSAGKVVGFDVDVGNAIVEELAAHYTGADNPDVSTTGVAGCTDEQAENFDVDATYETDETECMYDQWHYTTEYEDGLMSLDEALEELEELRMCTEDDLSGVASACEIVALSSDIDPPMMDPADAYDTSSGAVIENIYDTLYRYEASSEGTPVIVPRLATSHTISADGLTYTFTLREHVFFSNGEAFTAEDVAYSWCRVIEYGSPDSGVAWIMYETMSTCDGLVVVDDYTFSATLETAYSAFIPTIAFWIGAVTDAGTCEANRVITYDSDGSIESDDHCNTYLHENPLGTNAYVLGSYTPESEIVLTPNWLYWEEGNFNLNKITRSEVAEESTRVQALKDGEADFASVPTGSLSEVCLNTDTPTAITGDPEFNTDCGPENSLTVALGIMNTNPTCEDADGGDDVPCNQFMADGAVRRALSYIYDYDTAIDDIYDGFAIPLYGPIPQGMPFVETQHATFYYDLDEAATVLDAAGYTCDDHDSDASTDCQRFNGDAIRLYYNDGNVNREANANLMAQNLDLVGIAADVVGEPWGNMLGRMFGTANWDFMFLGWAPDYNDPDNYWFPFVASAAVHGDVYNTQYANDDIDALLLAAKTETDYAARAALYEEAHDLFMDEPSLIFMAQYLSYHVHSNRVSMPSEVPPATIPWFDVDKT